MGAGERLADLCALVNGKIEGDGEVRIEGVAPLASAGPGRIAYLADRKLLPLVDRCRASALVVSGDAAVKFPALLRTDDPEMAFARIARHFHPEAAETPGIDPRAAVEDGATVAPGTYVGPFAVVRAGSRIEADCRIHALAYVGRNCRIGPRCRLYPGAVLYDETELGADVIVHASTVIGADGFGYRFRDGKHVPIPQVGKVVLGDGVEVGANSAVDRATLDATTIGAGTKIDNLVQVGHNSRVGRHCMLCGQSGLAGSTVLGNGVVLGANAGVANHAHVGDGVQIGAKSGIHKDVPAGARMFGTPAREAKLALRVEACIGRLPEMVERVKELEARIAELEARLPRP